MKNTELLEVYLRHVIDFCQAYDAFSIPFAPAAMIAGKTDGSVIKMQDVYTHLSLISRDE